MERSGPDRDAEHAVSEDVSPVLQIQRAIGTLLLAGHRLDDVLDMTFAQIEVACECVGLVWAERINGLLGPVVAAASGGGARYTPTTVSGPSTKRPRDVEGGLRAGLAMMGLPIHEVPGG